MPGPVDFSAKVTDDHQHSMLYNFKILTVQRSDLHHQSFTVTTATRKTHCICLEFKLHPHFTLREILHTFCSRIVNHTSAWLKSGGRVSLGDDEVARLNKPV